MQVLASTGLRRGEALALAWTDVDMTKATLRVRGTLGRVDGALTITDTKTARSRRTIPLSAPTLAALRTLRSRRATERLAAGSRWAESCLVFTTEFGEPCDPRNVCRAVSVAATRAKLAGVGAHTLRHSAASLMLGNNVPLTVVSRVLGHSGIAITSDTYGHVSPDVSRSALDVLTEGLHSAQ